LADKIKKYDTTKLIKFLREQGLGLDEDDEKIIRNEKVAGRDFLKMTKQDFKDINMKAEPALTSPRNVKRRSFGPFQHTAV